MIPNCQRRILRSAYFILFLQLTFQTVVWAQGENKIVVSITDANGAAIPEARVRISSRNGKESNCGVENEVPVCYGAFSVGDIIVVTADGFQIFRRSIRTDDLSSGKIVIVMEVGPPTISPIPITITRADATIDQTPESVVVLNREAFKASAAPTLDDTLRQVPGFSLFRRTSGRNANPTAQGVSLRGTGASGASRSLVMLDGVPLNDPFGGWVQWNRVAPLSVETVEVLRGGASSLYSNSALSGAVDIRTRRPQEQAFSGEVFGGSSGTFGASAFAGAAPKSWLFTATGGHFQTRGYIPVSPEDRGPVDSFAGVRSSNLSAMIERSFGRFATLFFKPFYFEEARTNGTHAQINRTTSRSFVLGGDFDLSATDTPNNSRIAWRIFGGTQVYDQTFSAVNALRTSESLTRIQRSPSQNLGLSVNYFGSLGRHSFAAGFEGHEVRGTSNELGVFNGVITSAFGAGGRERNLGVFAKDVFSVTDRLILSGSIRFDRWNNFRGLAASRNPLNGPVNATAFPDRAEQALSPQFSVRWQANDGLAFHSVISKSFRAPTLNELYRGFRVGNVVTNANENLLAERAINFEAGTSYRRARFGIRASYFISEIERAISNVTISSIPMLITRERQNAGTIRAQGFEADASIYLSNFSITAGYLFADSRIREFASDPRLFGKLVPQVPRHQFTIQAIFTKNEWQASAQFRSAGSQFDDDLNLFRLEPYAQLDVFASRRFSGKFTIFAAAENIFNSRYSVGRTPLRTVSSPITIRAGIRWN